MTASSAAPPAFLSTLPAGSGQHRLAWAVVLVSTVLFVALAPFAKLQLPAVWPFIPVYQSALVVNDLVTAVLLFGQFRILCRRELLVLAGGYLVTAAMALLHMLSFPGLFAPGGLLGAGPQSTAWMYMFWHAAFPLCVIAYALAGRGREGSAPAKAGPVREIAACILAALAAAAGFAALATAGQHLLPPIMAGHRYTPAMIFVVSTVWACSMAALLVLWRRPSRSVLDLWLMVVMCAWLYDIALAAVLNGGRFDLGFYAGRLYGLLASGFVLGVLLLENGALYARLAEAHERELKKNAELRGLNEQLAGTNAMLGDANHQLQQASKFKSEFLANMSHELRTPLTAIIGFSELLKDSVAGPMSPKQAHFSLQIHESGQHLLELLNEVLDLSKVEAGKMALDLDGVEPDDFLRGCLATFEGATERRGIALVFEPLGQAARIAVDPRKLRQLVYNLLSNAIKFTPDGGTVRLALRRAPPGEPRMHDAQGRSVRLLPLRAPAPAEQGYLEIRVSDDGSGMSREDLALLFEAYRQLRSADGRGHVGTGLGLALVSRFAELHGGTVGVASAPGQGTCFAVWIPWREAPAAVVGPARPVAQDVQAVRPARRAVVIEDDPATTELLKLHLEGAGFSVTCVHDATDLQRIAQPVPDVITLDIMLPGHVGWDVLGRIKSHPVLAAVPVVIVSVLSDLQRGFALGASSVLQKPVGRQALIDAVRDAGLELPPSRACKVLVVDDDPAAVDLVATALEGPSCQVLKAYDGAAAVAMAREAEPDLIVLDLMMPGMSGFEVVEQVRRQPAMSSVPILVMTAQTVSPAEQDLLQGRVRRIMGKAMFDERRFLAEVRSALHGH